MTPTPKNAGWIELICGPMFSGKTEELIRRLRRAQIAKQNVAIFKPRFDNRYAEDFIVSHTSLRIESTQVDSPAQIVEQAGNAQVVGIDEAQFFDDSVVKAARHLAKLGKRVVVAGLDKDYLGKPFGPIPLLLTEAEYVTKVLSICVKCGNPANFSQRLTADTNQLLLGESDKYEARCRVCFEIEN